MVAYGSLLICLLSMGAPQADEKYDARLLLGTWEIQSAPPGIKGSVEFKKEEKVVLITQIHGKEEQVEGKYRTEGDSLSLHFSSAGKERVLKYRIQKLTEKECILKDEATGEEQVLKK